MGDNPEDKDEEIMLMEGMSHASADFVTTEISVNGFSTTKEGVESSLE